MWKSGLTSARHMGLKTHLGIFYALWMMILNLVLLGLNQLKAFNDKSIALVGGPTLPNFQTTVPFWFGLLLREHLMEDGLVNGYLFLVLAKI